MKKTETIIGFLVIFLAIFFVFFVIKITNIRISTNFYTLKATFENIEGVNIGAKVKIGGVEIGHVDSIFIDENYKPTLLLKINKELKLPIDSVIKISTSGIIGGKYLKVLVGSENEYFSENDSFEFIESTMDLEDLITKFFLNKALSSNDK